MASPILWACYILPLINRLRRLGMGCYIGYRRVAQKLDICEAWADETGIMFSTDPSPINRVKTM